jgi:predicted transcriptional regulator
MSIGSPENRSLGELELDTLRFVSEHAPMTVGEVAKSYGTPRGLARTTVLTVMERLRTKGFLIRRRETGIYRYSPRIDQRDVLSNLVGDFVQKSLGGSLSPFVSYLVDTGKLDPEQIEQLQRLVDSLESAGREARS